MGKPYRFTGETDHEYPTIAGLGTVKPGDVAYFEHRAPDHRWEPVEPQHDGDEGQAGDTTTGEQLAEVPARPAANAAKPEWQAYVAALGEPVDQVEGKTVKELQARADELEAAAQAAAEKAAEGGDGGAA